MLTRALTIYKTAGKTFGVWGSLLITGIFMSLLRMVVICGVALDKLFYPKVVNQPLKNPIIIVGNPRSGTTFLHRFFVKNNLAAGSQLWQMMFSSILLGKIIKPFLPLLEKVSPTRYHSSAAHKTSLQSVETDDASLLFRYLDGFFIYGFFLAWAEEDLFHWVDPKVRNTANRDYEWLQGMWSRSLYRNGHNRYVGKLFSASANMNSLLNFFPDSKVLYMVRDPLQVIPSGLSLVTGVLDKRFGFWSLPEDKRSFYLNRLYNALVELLLRFHSDWVDGTIDRSRVKIVTFNRLMSDFDNLMNETLEFLNIEPSAELTSEITATGEKQKQYKSGHSYNLDKFGLTEEQIQKDCKVIYDTFLKPNSSDSHITEKDIAIA